MRGEQCHEIDHFPLTLALSLRERGCLQQGHKTGNIPKGSQVHEMSITQGVVEICESNSDGRQVLAVVLEIGELSNVVPEAIEFCFEACTQGTLLDGAKLVIHRIPGWGRCRECSAEFAVKAYYQTCPGCGAYGIDLLAGEELRVKELEVE